MSSDRIYGVSDAERKRIELVDRLTALGESAVDELIRALDDPSWTVRRAVVGALAAIGEPAVRPLCAWLREQRTTETAIAAAVDALSSSIGGAATAAAVELAGDPRAAVVADAVQILGRRKAVEATAVLTKCLAGDDDNVAVGAIEALGAIGGTQAVEALIAALERRSFFRTFPAIQVLARMSDPRVVVPLTSLLDDETYRLEAARALGRSGFAQAIPPLAKLLHRANDAVVRVVAVALADLLERARWNGSIDRVVDALRAEVRPSLTRLVQALRTSDPTERTAIAAVLGSLGDTDALPGLVGLLDDAAANEAATTAIQQISRVHEDALIGRLATAITATRLAVLPVIGSLRAATAVRALLNDEEPEVRARAAEALARIGDTAAVPLLFSLLGDNSPRVSHAVTAAIHALGTDDTARYAIAAIGSANPGARRQALRIIAALGPAGTFDTVRRAIDDPDQRIAELAVAALARLPEPEVDSLLGALARDPRERIRAAVMRTATQRGGDTAMTLLEHGAHDDAAWVRYYACQGLGVVAPPGSLQLILARLYDPAPQVKVAAIEALGAFDTGAAWNALSAAARSTDPDERRAALGSMAIHASDRIIPFLLDGARSDDVATRLIALSGLAKTQHTEALRQLVAAVTDDDDQVRSAALSLLGDRQDAAAANAVVDLALELDRDHPVQQTLSRPSEARIEAIAARLAAVDDRDAPILASALARMTDDLATAALMRALGSENVCARRAAVSVLAATGGPTARAAISRLAASDTDPEVRRICAAATM
ncbi:MAG: HEAT repeat domain-containing protein [Kofleriaceae bacterium]